MTAQIWKDQFPRQHVVYRCKSIFCFYENGLFGLLSLGLSLLTSTSLHPLLFGVHPGGHAVGRKALNIFYLNLLWSSQSVSNKNSNLSTFIGSRDFVPIQESWQCILKFAISWNSLLNYYSVNLSKIVKFYWFLLTWILWLRIYACKFLGTDFSLTLRYQIS